MTSAQPEKGGQTRFAEVNPNPVLSAGADGELHFANPATSLLLQDLGLEKAEDILPGNHKELVRNCLKTSTPLTEKHKVGGRTLVWLYRSISDSDEVYIYGHDVTDYQSGTSGTTDFPGANPSPVLSSGADGALHFVNPATSQLFHDLGLESAEDILPRNHKELARNILKSDTPLTEERKVGSRTLVWLYRSVSDSDEVYIYGHDVSDYQSGTSGTMDFPGANPSPVLSSGADGALHFVNPATSQLLQDLGLESVEDILPVNHKHLAWNCLKTSTPLTEERKVGGRTLVWLYRSVSGSDEVHIYCHDISGSDPKIFCIEGFPKANPNPIFSSGPDGVPRYMNYATSKLIQDLGLENTEDILPHNHKELVNACLKTSAPVIRERKVGGRTIIWSYYPIDDSDLIYIYGHDITGYHPNIF
ncbi:MAG: hypothetical protein OEU51_06545 [Gammaproteobacteria bacterium]|nr:hypothetical protein [Gammaproteobacteria bacterium]